MTQHILIAGDSWGMGEWHGRAVSELTLSDDERQRAGISHAGLEQYILDHTDHQVGNVSVGGGSNALQIHKINDYILRNTVDKIIWFQTDPLRDCRYVNNPEKFWEDKSTLAEFLDRRQTYLESTYTRLNEINVPIYCIGGCFPLDVKSLESFENLIPFIPSVIKLLCNDSELLPTSTLCRNWSMAHVPLEPALVNFLYAEIELVNLWQVMLNQPDTDAHKYFLPDGKHPNRLGHQRMFKMLVDQGLV